MFTLFRKEIFSFLNSLIGYLAIIVFLLINGLFLWVFPLGFNIVDYGYASLDNLFTLSPFVFLFLIPAITMRSFADEKRSGTIEMLLTKPLTDIQIILAKYLAGVTLVFFSLLPTLIYAVSVYLLGLPKGNLDMGGMWGSYLGLLFLASAFVAIGIFVSSITDNQIVAFILALALSGFAYTGFDFISELSLFGKADLMILSLGIQNHYASMSRGVIDSRNVIYFLSLISIFILLTKIVLESRKWEKSGSRLPSGKINSVSNQ
ncbi:MAG: gliding motility-associated ABC transporter permease subunit GldF [Bacteroidetes bacterium HGW-Bacteroidetes-9]|jgi:ABC-2 type transport system permease protein|nr:MAG: gliding motility-associated ABC transporter permease subunit GldF [Bacteroidetes bacterium HGW-Bacteroidetes-9]